MQEEDIIFLPSRSSTSEPEIIKIDDDEFPNVPNIQVHVNDSRPPNVVSSANLRPCRTSNDSCQQMGPDPRVNSSTRAHSPILSNLDFSFASHKTTTEKLKQIQFEDFDPLNMNVETWLAKFEEKMEEFDTFDQSMSIVVKFLNDFGLDFYRQAISENPRIEWSDFRCKFAQNFMNFKYRKTREALTLAYTGGSVQEYMNNKMKLLKLVLPTTDERDLVNMAISSIRDEDLSLEITRSFNKQTINQSTTSRPPNPIRASTSKENYNHESKEWHTSLRKTKSESKFIDSSSSESQDNQSSYAPMTVENSDAKHSSDKTSSESSDEYSSEESEFSEFKISSTIETKLSDDREKSDRDRILMQWLLQNYKKTENQADMVKIDLVFTKALAYYLSIRKGQISREEFTELAHFAFSKLPIIESFDSNQMIVKFFGCLKEKMQNETADQEMRLSKTDKKHFNGDISKQWLFDHYERTEDSKSMIATKDILNKLSDYLMSFGRSPVTKQKLGFLLRSVFGRDLKNKQIVVQSVCHGFYQNLKEKGDHIDASNDQKETERAPASALKFEHEEMVLEWLRNNYELGSGRDKTNSKILRYNLFSYLKLNGVLQLPSNKKIGCLIIQQFGRLPYMRVGPKLIPHYGNLKKKKTCQASRTSNPEIKRPERNKIAIEWLRKNYKKTGKPSDKVNSKDLRIKLSAYLNSQGQEPVCTFVYGVLIKSAFGRLPYLLLRQKAKKIGFYSTLKAITCSDHDVPCDVPSDAQDSFKLKLESERIAVDWLTGFYEKSGSADDSIRRKVIYEKTNAYLQSMGKAPLGQGFISLLIRRIFGVLPLLRTKTDSYHFANLKEKSALCAREAIGEEKMKIEKDQIQNKNVKENHKAEDTKNSDQKMSHNDKNVDTENSAIEEPDDRYAIIVKWLESNYKRTNCESDLVRCNDVIIKLQNYFHDLGRKKLPVSLIDDSILWVFDKLPLAVKPKGTAKTFYYKYLKEKSTSDIDIPKWKN